MCVTGENIISAPDRSNDNESSSVRFDHGLRFGRRVLRSSPTEGGGVLKYAPDRYGPCPHIWISMSHLVAKLPTQRTLSSVFRESWAAEGGTGSGPASRLPDAHKSRKDRWAPSGRGWTPACLIEHPHIVSAWLSRHRHTARAALLRVARQRAWRAAV